MLRYINSRESFMCLYFRSALRFVCGIFVFGVTWILLGRSSESSISSATWKQFMVSVSGVLSLPKIKYVIQKYFVDNFEVVTSQRQEGQRIGQNLNPVD